MSLILALLAVVPPPSFRPKGDSGGPVPPARVCFLLLQFCVQGSDSASPGGGAAELMAVQAPREGGTACREDLLRRVYQILSRALPSQWWF